MISLKSSLNSISQQTTAVCVIMPALQRLRQEDHRFKSNLGYGKTPPHTQTKPSSGLPKIIFFLSYTVLYSVYLKSDQLLNTSTTDNFSMTVGKTIWRKIPQNFI